MKNLLNKIDSEIALISGKWLVSDGGLTMADSDKLNNLAIVRVLVEAKNWRLVLQFLGTDNDVYISLSPVEIDIWHEALKQLRHQIEDRLKKDVDAVMITASTLKI